MRGLLGQEEALGRLEAALAGSPADATELVMLGESTSVTRYANSEIHQNVEQTGVRVAVRATARVFTGSLDSADLRAAIEQATTLARLQAPDPRWTPLPSPSTGFPTPAQFPQCWFEATATLPPRARAEAVGVIIDAAAQAGFQAYGTYLSAEQELAVVSTMGIRSHATYTTAYLKALVEGPEGTGFGDALSRDARALDPEAVARQAVAKCQANHEQASIDPATMKLFSTPTRSLICCDFRRRGVWEPGSFWMGNRSSQARSASR